ncbi:MAG TPA: hypothetical protein VJ552_01760 [Sediminibacterium sp.]|nr:hypothetical protein [Sediminibacterium sp.]
MRKTSIHLFPAQARYLYPLWAVGTMMFIYLSLPFFRQGSGMFLPDVLNTRGKFPLVKRKSEQVQKEKGVNEAYLFVNIHQKHFLTRFVTYISDEELAARAVNDNNGISNNRSFLVVDKKKSAKKSRERSDFFIGSAPKI